MPASHLSKTPDLGPNHSAAAHCPHRPGRTGSITITCLMGVGLSTPAAAQELAATWQQRPGSLTLALVLGVIVLVMLSYGVRQMLYALNRVFGKQRYP